MITTFWFIYLYIFWCSNTVSRSIATTEVTHRCTFASLLVPLLGSTCVSGLCCVVAICLFFLFYKYRKHDIEINYKDRFDLFAAHLFQHNKNLFLYTANNLLMFVCRLCTMYKVHYINQRATGMFEKYIKLFCIRNILQNQNDTCVWYRFRLYFVVIIINMLMIESICNFDKIINN